VIPYQRGLPAAVETGRARFIRRYHRPHQFLHPAEPMLDARRYGLPRDQLYLGTLGRRWVVAPWQQSAILIGPSGSGKSRSVIAPNVLLWDGPVVATSSKRDLLDLCVGVRTHRGAVWVFDPLGVLGELPRGVRRLCWSPLRGCADHDVAVLRAQHLGVDTRGVENGGFWATRGRQLVAELLHAAALGGVAMGSVHSWVAQQRLAPALALCERHGARRSLEVLQSLQIGDERQLRSVFAQASAMLSVFDSSRILAQADQADACGFDPDDFLERPNTVFVVCPSDAQISLASLVVGLVEEIRSAALRVSDRSASGELPLPLLLALDEVANIAPLPSLPAILAEGRARSIIVLCAFQTYGQAEALWRQRADGLVFSGGCSLFLAGVRDEHVLRRLELLGGRHFVPQVARSVSRSSRGPLDGWRWWDVQRTVSENHGWVEVPRLPAGVISAVRQPQAWLLMRGLPVGFVESLDLSGVSPFLSWALLRGVVDVARHQPAHDLEANPRPRIPPSGRWP
jgi:type IV secretion system protein VirD4